MIVSKYASGGLVEVQWECNECGRRFQIGYEANPNQFYPIPTAWSRSPRGVACEDCSIIRTLASALFPRSDEMISEWTAESPTIPGHYLCAYRFSPSDRWVYVRMHLTQAMVPVKPDTSDTRWYGPIPALED